VNRRNSEGPELDHPEPVATDYYDTSRVAAATVTDAHDTAIVVREPTAWLRGRGAERVRAALARGLDPHDGPDTIITPLGRHPRNDRDDRTCDRCDTYVPPGTLFWPVVLHPARQLLVIGGLCGTCKDLEVVR